MNRRGFLKISSAAIGSSTVVPLALGQFPSQTVRRSDVFSRQLRFAISIANPKTQELRDQVLWFYMPVAETATQKLDSLKISLPYEQTSDPLGHTIVKLSFPTIAPLGSKVISIIANVILDAVPRTTPVTNVDAWLASERYIEAKDVGIQTLAATLKGASPRDTSKAIYDWVRQHIGYAGYIADDLGALYALNYRRGDCTEYAYLVTALARANGIPTRMVGGYVAEGNIAPRAEDYHNWAEMYFDGAWQLVDAQKEHWLTSTELYVAFCIHHATPINPIGMAHRFSIDGAIQARF